VSGPIRSALLLCWLLLATAPVGADPRAAGAEQAALGWLSLVDEGRYDASWDTAAELFRSQVSPESWNASITQARGLFGELRQRELAASQYATTLPGAPDGEYVVLRFDASFAAKAAAVETVTVVRENGAWRVTGYFIQ
jgi:hypothetical protein